MSYHVPFAPLSDRPTEILRHRLSKWSALLQGKEKKGKDAGYVSTRSDLTTNTPAFWDYRAYFFADCVRCTRRVLATDLAVKPVVGRPRLEKQPSTQRSCQNGRGEGTSEGERRGERRKEFFLPRVSLSHKWSMCDLILRFCTYVQLI